MREWRVRSLLGETGLRVVVNPSRIDSTWTTFPYQKRAVRNATNPLVPAKLNALSNRLAWELREFRICEADITRQPIVETPIYLRMKDVFVHRDALTDSRTYAEIEHVIRSTGFWRHKGYTIRELDEIEQGIHACFLDMILSMQRYGYLPDQVSDHATGGIGNAFIDRDGSILKATAASHRLAAAKIVGLRCGFPLRIIGCHAEWLRDCGIQRNRDLHRLADAIREAEAAFGSDPEPSRTPSVSC